MDEETNRPGGEAATEALNQSSSDTKPNGANTGEQARTRGFARPETKRERAYFRARYREQTSGGEFQHLLDDELAAAGCCDDEDGGRREGWSYQSGEERRGKVIAQYIYCDEYGTNYLLVQRTDQKQFLQAHWDGSQWAWGKPRGPKIPYRLPELIAAGPEQAVHITEGEKDADNVSALGLAATCCSEGAGKWTSELDKWFEGKTRINIFQDNDEPGRRHALQVARHLVGIVREVRIVSLPGLAEHGDVSDWLSSGHTREELLAQIEATPIYRPENSTAKLVLSNAEFVSGFSPPDFLIDGLVQRRFLYGLTAPTNAGKTTVALRLAAHVVSGTPIGDRTVERGKVLFFAGENADDVRMRWLRLSEEMTLGDAADGAHWVAGQMAISALRDRLNAETEQRGPFSLVVIDSAAAFFEGNDENDNTQLGNYARMLRTLTGFNDGPAIVVLCHPVKNFNADNLLPRGGGAFLNEVDGNLVLVVRSEIPKIVELHWHGKLRGPDFAPVPFKLTPSTSDRLRDSKGRLLWTVTAAPLTADEAAGAEGVSRRRQDELLAAMRAQPGASLAQLAAAIGWRYANGEPNKSLANRVMRDLEARRLVTQAGGRWTLNRAGQRAAEPAGEGPF